MPKNNIINVRLFGQEIGRIGLDEHQAKSYFQYNPDYLSNGQLQNIFPKTGIIKRVPHAQVFSQFDTETFNGLPPQIADSLPDMFGNIIFKTWLDTKGKQEINILEQLAYVSNRGMGALEYYPSIDIPKDANIDLEEIISVLKSVLNQKRSTKQNQISTEALINIFKIGTSAGGARPKILISKHKTTGQVIPGDLVYSNEYEHYLVKLSIDEEHSYPRERVEHCYYLTAKELGINMMPSKLMENKHFAIQRFDRQNGTKQHILTATGLTGWDYKSPQHSSYENLFKLCSFLKIPHAESEELYLRMIFNIIYRNTDDHLKNHSFIYNKQENNWNLAPAYDITYALNPLVDFKIINRALSVNNKRNNINIKDVLKVADDFTIKNPKGIITKVQNAIPILKKYLIENDIPTKITNSIVGKIKPVL